MLVETLKNCNTIGSSHGLLCLYRTGRVVLWNLSIRKAVAVVVPNVENETIYKTVLGFGVCRETNDPKIVKIPQIKCWTHIESITSIPWQVEVFTLSTGDWRSPYNNLPRKSIQLSVSCSVSLFVSHVFVDGFLYWLATDRITMDGEIMFFSFDVTSEEFTEVNLPDSLADNFYLSLSKLRESLVVFKHNEDESYFVVWMMEYGVSKSFTKLFTISTTDISILRVLAFRKTDEPIIDTVDFRKPIDASTTLAVYDTYTNHVTDIGINGVCSFSVYPYMETRLLLDHPNCIVYDKGRRYIRSGGLKTQDL
ncbi:hypothetical protein L1987_65255 [Smallanthus sonchifolius]|uniref:Uncharacterized protein n=1 Tax=Smallanthus sonchifolius TaxID=185202 RepID=A0ACB9BU02_9ASTR|nr:hypothetical protein L1987_65255 [Smallanthus sonchifolius]